MPERNSITPSPDDDVPNKPGAGLQFDQAEYATSVPSGPTCAACKRAIVDEYYELGGKVFCALCRQGVETAMRGGSRFARVMKALVFGSAAAAVGALIYYVILRATGYNIGLVAVLVGFMVGGAVRRGTGNRGGLFYQVIAVFLTYTAIGAMHIPFMFDEPDQPEPKGRQADSTPRKAEKSPATANDLPHAPRVVVNDPARSLPDIPRNPFANAPAKDAKETAAPVQGAENEQPAAMAEPRAIIIPIVIAMVVLIVYASPILHAFQAPISGIIFGFALWEAWKINKRVQLLFDGPFRVSANGSDENASEVDDGR